jgi:flagellum-specific peptidoglycan hydrolase FlgJ
MKIIPRILLLTVTGLVGISIAQGTLQKVVEFADPLNEMATFFLVVVLWLIQLVVIISELKKNKDAMSVATASLISILIIISYPLLTSAKEKEKEIKAEEEIKKHYNDSIRLSYSIQAQKYLDRKVFKSTPLTGEMLAECAIQTYDSTGILVPVELVLAQAQVESGMGRKGRSPINNPFNIGEWNKRTVTVFKSTRQGVQSYFNRMASDYLSCRSMDSLLQNFVNCQGYRYAGSKTYERKIRNQIQFIKRFLTR